MNETEEEKLPARTRLKMKETKIVIYLRKLLLDKLNQLAKMQCMIKDYLIRPPVLKLDLETMRIITFTINLYSPIELQHLSTKM